MFFEGKCMGIGGKKRGGWRKKGIRFSRENRKTLESKRDGKTQRKGLSSFFPSRRRDNLKQVAGFWLFKFLHISKRMKRPSCLLKKRIAFFLFAHFSISNKSLWNVLERTANKIKNARSPLFFLGKPFAKTIFYFSILSRKTRKGNQKNEDRNDPLCACWDKQRGKRRKMSWKVHWEKKTKKGGSNRLFFFFFCVVAVFLLE